MKKRMKPYVVERRLVNARDLADYLGYDLSKAASFGTEAGACCRIGRRLLYDLRAIDDFIELKVQEHLTNAPSLKAVEETLAQMLMDDYGVTKNTARKILAEVLISEALKTAISEEACEVQRRSFERD